MRIPLEKTKNNKKPYMPVDMPSHPFQIIPQTPSDLSFFLFCFCFLDWNLHIPASTLGFFNLFWFGHAPPPRPDHTSNSPGPKVFLLFLGFFWLESSPSSIDPRFFQFVLVWTCPAYTRMSIFPGSAEAGLAIYIYIYIYMELLDFWNFWITSSYELLDYI